MDYEINLRKEQREKRQLEAESNRKVLMKEYYRKLAEKEHARSQSNIIVDDTSKQDKEAIMQELQAR